MLKLVGLNDFKKDINAFASKVEDSPAMIAKKIMLEINKQTVLNAPVITGRYVGAWQISEGVNPTNLNVYVSNEKVSEAGAKNEQLLKNSTKIQEFSGGTLWLTNNTEYALVLEYGDPERNRKAQYILTRAIQYTKARVKDLLKEAV